jgi:enterochelin esterase-like enzyme
MLAFANEGLMIPEQVWDKKEVPAKIDSQYIPPLKFGEGTGSATPLAWSMGQFIRLATNLKAGRNLDTPQVVYDRYKNGIPTQTNDFGGQESFVLPPMRSGELLKVPRNAPPGSKIAYVVGDETHVVTADDKGKYSNDLKVQAADTLGIAGIMASDGSTAFERIRLLKQPEPQTFTPAQVAAIASARSNPATADGKVFLVYRGKASRVEVAGDMTGWAPGRVFMQKVGEDVWAVALGLAPTARVEYKIVADGQWLTDPLNPNKMDNGVGGENNFFAMPGYQPSEWDKGDALQTEKFDIETKNFGKRSISVYVPAGVSEPMHVLYLQDGGAYVTRARAIQTQRNLVKAGKVKPFVMVFIDPKDRNKEYWANDQWADFVADELVNEIDKRYRTVPTRDGRATLGASLGGVTSLWIGLRHPDKFAKLGGQSSSFWIDGERTVKELSRLDEQKTKFRFYLDDGVLEGVDDTRRVNVMLRGKGYPVTYVEGQTGHNWTAWRDRLADAFVALMN